MVCNQGLGVHSSAALVKAAAALVAGLIKTLLLALLAFQLLNPVFLLLHLQSLLCLLPAVVAL